MRIVTETGKPAAQLARDLGISPYTLHNWVQAERRRTEPSPGGVTESEREELARLRAEKARWPRKKPSWRWSVMSSSAPWSCG